MSWNLDELHIQGQRMFIANWPGANDYCKFLVQKLICVR